MKRDRPSQTTSPDIETMTRKIVGSVIGRFVSEKEHSSLSKCESNKN